MPEKVLNLLDSMKLLERSGLKFAKYQFVKNEKELISVCKKLHFPVVLKIVSDKLIHKTDKGGIKLGIDSDEKALKSFKQLKKLPGFKGVVVQQMVKGREVIIGGKIDPQFGATVLFGLGGIYVELLKDVSLRICPVEKKDVKEMVSEIKGYNLLKGLRGEKPINFTKLESIISKVNNLMLKGKVKELDLNPLMASEKDVVAVDARVVV